MLKSIRLKNFKCYEDSREIELAPLTIIIGVNNTGKSTIFQSLLALKQTVRARSYRPRLVTKGRYVDLGSFYDILHRKSDDPEGTRKIGIGIKRVGRWEKDPVPGRADINQFAADEMQLSFAFNRTTNKIRLAKVNFLVKGESVLKCNESGKWDAPHLSQPVRDAVRFHLHNFIPVPHVADPKSLKDEKLSRAVFEAASTFNFQGNHWARFFDGIDNVPPHRSHVPFFAVLGEQSASEYGRSGPELLRVLAGQIQAPNRTPVLLGRLNEWVCKRFEALNKMSLRPIDRAELLHSLVATDASGAENINVAAMGEGISQLLPIVASILLSDEDETLLIEQPEVHLHPKLQSELADLLIEQVKNENRQLLVETHSEHLLLRIRTHIAKGDITADKVAVLFVSKKGGKSTVERLDLNDRGHFGRWPEGFFDESYQEAMALAMAQPAVSPKK